MTNNNSKCASLTMVRELSLFEDIADVAKNNGQSVPLLRRKRAPKRVLHRKRQLQHTDFRAKTHKSSLLLLKLRTTSVQEVGEAIGGRPLQKLRGKSYKKGTLNS